MTPDGIRSAFLPPALEVIVETNEHKDQEIADAQSLYQKIINSFRKVTDVLNLTDRGLTGVKKLKNDIDDIGDLFD